MNLFNLFKPKKLISYSKPYSYFAILNTLIDIGKERGRVHSWSEIQKLIYLICGLYSGYYKKRLINEGFFIYLPGIVLTNRYYNYFMNNKTPNHNLYTKYIKVDGYVELIDKECEDYKTIYDTYKFLSQYTETQIYSLVSNDYIELKDGTIINCPVKSKLIKEGYENFYDEKYTKLHPDYRQKVMEELILLKPYLDSNYISKYFSYWFKNTEEYKNIKPEDEENNNIKIEEPEILD